VKDLLRAEAIGCTFPGGKAAVRDLSLTLREGELVGLIGPDGAGKTTSFRMLVGLQKPTSGRIFRNLDPGEIGYVSQAFSLNPDFTVLENLRLQAGLFGMVQPLPRIAKLLESVDLDPFADRRAGALSGGMKQKLALCSALLTSPRLLLLDEPTTGVDPVSRREFWDLLHDVHDDGVAILFSTPYMDEAEYAHRVLLMEGGRILDQGETETLRRRLPGLVVRVETDDSRLLGPVLAGLGALDTLPEGGQLRARFPEQPVAPLLAALRALPGVHAASVAAVGLEDLFLHHLVALESVHG
jgi:ABC-2 type transport system ATP-binding protein